MVIWIFAIQMVNYVCAVLIQYFSYLKTGFILTAAGFNLMTTVYLYILPI